MTDLPQPLTPADCDLTKYPFVPIHLRRLLTSETWVLGSGDERAAAIALWLESWHQSPAASLPDNDRMLDHLSQSKVWKRVKEHALRGWIKCSDGKLYHPVVAEMALSAWIDKLMSSLSGSAGNAKRWDIEVDTDAVKAQIIDAVERLVAIAPQSEVLKKKQLKNIVKGSHPESHPDKKSIAPRSSKTSHPESGGDRNREETESKQKENIKPIGAAVDSTVGGIGGDQRAAASSQGHSGQPDRAVAVSILLRRLGVKPMTAQHPLALQWGANEKCTDQLLEQGIETARERKPLPEPIHPNYLAPIIAELLNPPPPRHDNSWRASDQATDAKARELGIAVPLGWSYAQLRDKIQAEIDRLKRQPPAPDGRTA